MRKLARKEKPLCCPVFIDAPTGENEAANRGNEAREERVERKRSDEQTVGELHDAREHHVDQIGVDEFQLPRRAALVLIVEFAQNADDLSQLAHCGRERSETKQTRREEIVFFFLSVCICVVLRTKNFR